MKEDEVEQHLWDALDLDHGEEQVRLIEDTIAAADTYQNEELQFETRMGLVTAGIFSGFIEKAIVAFSWCLATFDRDSEKYSHEEYSLLWAHKWIGQNMIIFASIDKARLLEFIEDFERRYKEKGISLRPIYSQQVLNRIELGESEERIQAALNAFVQAPRDSYSDCSACEQNFLVEVALYQNDQEKAGRYAAPIFNGSKTCAEVPHITYAIMTLPTLYGGDRQLANTYAKEAERLCIDNRDFIYELSELIAYHVAVKQYDDALRIFNVVYRWELETRIDNRKRHFCAAAGLLFEHLPNQDLLLSLPESSDIFSEEGRYKSSELVGYYTKRSDEIAARFDLRNENEHISDQLEEHRTTIRRYASQ